jgi:hypothetical protein
VSRRSTLLSIADTVAIGATAAWVGGHAALGAFAARIAFRDLPRADAAATMTTVFRSFDGLVVVALALIAVATAARLAVVGRASLKGAPFVAALAAAALLAVGLAGIAWVHPEIERLFHEGATVGPHFAAMHKMSERLGHLEVGFALLLFGSLSWRR